MSFITDQQAKLDLELIPKEKRVHGQDFDELPTDKVIVSFKELGHTGKSSQSPMLLLIRCINLGELLLLLSTKVYLERQPVLTSFVFLEHKSFGECTIKRMWTMLNYFGKISLTILTTKVTKSKKRCTTFDSPKLSFTTSLPKTRQDAPGVSVSKKKAPTKADRDKGIELLLDAALLEDAQLKKALKKIRQETHRLQASGNSKDGNKSDDNNDKGSENDDDGGNDAQDSKRTDSNEEENPNLNLNVNEEKETQEEEYAHTPNYSVPTDEETDYENKGFDDKEYDDLYKDVNVRSKIAKHEEVGKGDVEMTDATPKSDSQEKSYEQVVKDAHVTLTTSQKTEGSKQSSSVSSHIASKFLILDNIPPVIDEVASIMNVKVRQEESRTQRDHDDKDKDDDPSAGSDRGLNKRKTSKDVKLTKEEPEFEFADSDIPQNQEGNLGNDDEEPIREVPSKRTAFKLLKGTRTNFAELEYDFEEFNKALLKKLDWDNLEGGDYPFDLTKPLPLLMNGNHQIVSIDYFFNNDLMYLQGGILTMTYTTSITKTKAAQKSVQAEEPEFEFADSDIPQNQEGNLGNDDEEPIREVPSKRTAFKLLKGTRTNFAELEYDFEEFNKALLKKLDWDNLEGGDYPFDLTKPLPLLMNGNHQIVSIDYFFNNDLMYLQGGILTMTYTTSITKTKAAQYDLLSIEEMVPNIWSHVKVAYDKHAI
nr:hypothetical protein [Tanacetum cinerariifolium]